MPGVFQDWRVARQWILRWIPLLVEGVTDSLHIKPTDLTLTADVPALTEQCTHTHTHTCTYSYIYVYSFMKFLLSTPLTI